MQQIGIAAFSGIAPVEFVLANASDVIIDDWIICRDWLKTYRQDEAHQRKDDWLNAQLVDYHRRHGEWLFCLAVLWTDKWNKHYRETLISSDRKRLAKRLRVLSRADANLMTEQVARGVYDITGMWVLPLKWYQLATYLLFWRRRNRDALLWPWGWDASVNEIAFSTGGLPEQAQQPTMGA